jgi:hypothetical protein
MQIVRILFFNLRASVFIGGLIIVGASSIGLTNSCPASTGRQTSK